MFPILVQLGPLSIRTLSLFLIAAALAAAFAYWRKTREEHYDEVMVFDAWIVASVAGLIGARLGGFVFQVLQGGLSEGWLAAWQTVRYQPLVGLLVGGIVLRRFAEVQKWDVWEILDYWCLGLSVGWGILWIGLFFDGTSLGVPTTLPLGLRFPGLFSAVHPVQLYFAGLYFALYAYLNWAEYQYRTFSWYRAGKNTAQSGYLTAIFILMTGIFLLVLSPFRPAQFVVGGVPLDIPLFVLTTMVGIRTLWVRSGRGLLLGRRAGSP